MEPAGSTPAGDGLFVGDSRYIPALAFGTRIRFPTEVNAGPGSCAWSVLIGDRRCSRGALNLGQHPVGAVLEVAAAAARQVAVSRGHLRAAPRARHRSSAESGDRFTSKGTLQPEFHPIPQLEPVVSAQQLVSYSQDPLYETTPGPRGFRSLPSTKCHPGQPSLSRLPAASVGCFRESQVHGRIPFRFSEDSARSDNP